MSAETRSKPDAVLISGMMVDCIVGLYPHERRAPQPLQLDLRLELDTRTAVQTGSLAATVDYARLCGEIRFILKSSRFLLVEEAAEAIARYVLTDHSGDPSSRAQSIEVRLTKPRAMQGLAVPAIEIFRRADEYLPAEQGVPVQLVYETRGCGIYRIVVQPGEDICVQRSDAAQQAELAVSPHLLLWGDPLPVGAAHHWTAPVPRRYQNHGDADATLLGIYRPPKAPVIARGSDCLRPATVPEATSYFTDPTA